MAATAKKVVVDPVKARDEMLTKLEGKRGKLKDNTAYYESERRPQAIGIAVPPEMQALLANVGYPRLYVNALSDRLEVEGFRMSGKDADDKLWDWWQANDLDVEATLGHTESFIHGSAFVTIAAPDPKVDVDLDPTVPLIRVEPPTNLVVTIDPRTKKVSQALRGVYNEEGTDVVSATLYLPDQTIIFDKQDGDWLPPQTINHGLEMVPVVPLANRIKLSDLYGTSEITPELKSVTDAASRIMMDMQATAELMGVPLRLIFGVKPSELGLNDDNQTVDRNAAFAAYYARILSFQDPDAKAQQFTAAELRNFVDALDALDKKAAAYTGLPPQYLSFNSDNPASAEAIKSSESRLVKNAERKAKVFGGAWEQVMRVATKVMGSEIPTEMFRMEAIWRDPSTPTYAAMADAATKLYAGGLGVIPKERARIDLGYSVEERLQMKAWDDEENPVALALSGMSTAPRTGAAASAPDTSAAKPAATTTASPKT